MQCQPQVGSARLNLNQSSNRCAFVVFWVEVAVTNLVVAAKMKFYLNKPIISEKEKLSWEKGDKLPRINLSQYEIIDGTLDDIEKHIIEFVKKSFTDIKEAMTINEFEELNKESV